MGVRNTVNEMPDWFKNAILTVVLGGFAVAGIELIKNKVNEKSSGRAALTSTSPDGTVNVSGQVLEKFLDFSERQIKLSEQQVVIQRDLVEQNKRIEQLALETNGLLRDQIKGFDAPFRMIQDVHRRFFANNTANGASGSTR